jgi:energy-coupling factor transporter ATP-binding protein EcfA2
MRACDNPFRVQRLARLAYRLEGTTWEALLARWDALGRRAALVGPEGRGKSTLLAELGGLLVERDGVRLRAVVLRRGERRLPRAERARLLDGVEARDLLLVDGAQELASWEWRRLCEASRDAGGLLVTSHRAGLLPTLHECRTTPELLDDLLAELLRGERDESLVVPIAEAAAMFARHHGNLRDALLAAYDHCAARSDLGAGVRAARGPR